MIFTRDENFLTFIRRYPSVTMFCIGLIVIQFATYYYGNGPTDIETARNFGAIYSSDTDPENWYRLVTYIFVQIGGMYHFLANFVSLLILGPPLERIYGSAKFTLLFLLTGIAGGIFILIFSDNVIAAGASGSIFGLYGLYAGLLLKRHKMIGDENKSFIWGSVAVSIVYTFVVPNISISAHLGGLFSGLLLSFIIPTQTFKSLAKTKWSESIFHTVMVTSVIIFSLFMAKEIPLNTFNQALLKIDEIRYHFSNDENSVAKSESQTNDSIETISIVESGDTEEGILDNSYEDFHIGTNAILEGDLEKGIAHLRQIKKSSEIYDQAIEYINLAENNLYMQHANHIDYRLLKKDADHYRGMAAWFYGEISYIQEMNDKTIMVLTLNSSNQFDSDQIIVLFPNRTHLLEGEYITIFGDVVGGFYNNYDYILDYLKVNDAQNFTIYFSAFTTQNLVPVIDTKVIDQDGWLIQ